MPKNCWFKCDWDDWLSDEALSGCSLEAQGLWLRCICFMYRADVAELTGSVEQLRRKLGVMPEELERCLRELKDNKAADVRFGNGDVSIVSRRRKRELNIKERNKLYVAKHRVKDECKTDVSIQSKSKSKNKIKPSEADVQETDEIASLSPPDLRTTRPPLSRAAATPAAAELDVWLTAVASVTGAASSISLPKYNKWESVCMAAIREHRDLPRFLNIITSEIERTKGQEQFFSPDTCLQKLQMDSVKPKPSKWMHEV